MALMAIIALLSSMLIPFVTTILSILVGWVALMVLFRTLKKKTSSRAVRRASDFFSREYSMTVVKLPPSLEAAEAGIMNLLQAPGDTHDTLNARYAEMIGVVPAGSEVPRMYNHLITKRVLWEYFVRYGDVTKRFMTPFRLDAELAVVPIPDDKKTQFAQFCLAQSLR